ncbi:hypothetical protein LDENG_00238730%2C partial [Xyrichtys novacula]|uniref:Gypsy retrotransposon integrase-like protein 1 n=1 Tax=Xyrichtys novacula TaxID=13765 RepID=A0AAV1FWF5_XYRNO|nr:hypothetical protein LDENG_00238730%2C partial [Xyrichtys novacula]
MPHSLISDQSSEQVFHTLPSRAISLFPTVPLDHDTICQVDLSEDSQMVLHTVQVLNVSLEPEAAPTPSRVEPSISPTVQTPEHDPDFDAKVEQLLAEADALNGEEEREKLRKLPYKYRASFAKDSLDCGLTSIHSVRILKPLDAPPTFVCQYKIPLASYEPIQEIIDDLLAKGIIRPCNSTYSAPLWPVLKPNGKWQLTIDYRKLNQQVPLSRWPMAQLQQDLPKITDARYFSILDVASGFWTIPVHKADQHKLAFTFANRQYTFTRCPFGYANSPAEFNIFLNKACPDASERGTLIYVDDILMRSQNLDMHLAEIDHVLNQLTNAGAKISLSKCQWCRTKVNYVGLLVGPTGVEPQLSRIQGLSNQQQHAMQALKDRLCAAPCLAYPDYNRPFYLEVGFSCHCLSAGLYQIHNSDKRVVAYASKTLLAPELKFSDCEKALLATVWAVKHFSNYLGGQKVIVETNHQPVTFLNSQRIRDGVVTNARVASWLMALQSFDIEVHYTQNRKTPLGMELAACQSYLTDSLDTRSPTCDPEPPELSCHRYFDDNVCKDIITAYVDGCSYHHDTVIRAGVGVIWVDKKPCEPLSFNLGAQTSQYAEVAGILIVLQLAVEHKIHALTICTDSNYARLSFSCHLPLCLTGSLFEVKKPLRFHKELFLACDFLTTKHDLQIYWKKVRGHSRILGPDKMFNDQADSLAKQGALTGSNWHFEPSVFPISPVPLVCAITRAQSQVPPCPAPSGPVSATVAPAFSDSDLLALQASDPAIAAMTQFLSRPPDSSMSPDLHNSIPDLRYVFRVRSSLQLVKGFLVYVSDALTSPALVVPRSHRGVMLTYAHDTPCAGHRGNKATLHALQQVAYWPHMQKDVADYIKGCLPGEASIATAYTTHQYMTDLHQHLKANFAFTQVHLSKSAEGRKSYYDQKASQQELQVAHWRQSPKVWETGWAGPDLITEKLSSVVYQIKITKGNKEPTLKWVHRNQIKLHHNPMGLDDFLILGLVAAPASPEIVEPGPDSGIVLRDQPGLLITDCRLHTQKVFVRLNPKEVLKKNVPVTAQLTSRAGTYWIQDLLSTATREAITPLQAHLAYTLDSAVLIYVNLEDREIAFLINLPIIASGSIYRLKDVVNTPPVVAYHDSNPDLYLAPNLRMCTRTKDIHYRCPSKPFVWDSTNGLCGLTTMVPDTRCPTTARHRSQVTVTQAERVGHRWLVNTPTKTAIVNYDQHDTATRISLLDQTMWIEVPPNAILHIDDIALYYLNPDQIETEIEVPAFFSKHTLQLDPSTIFQIQYAGTQTTDLTPVDDVLIDIRSQEKSPLQPIVYVWSTPDTLLATTIGLGYLLTFGLTFIYVKCGRSLQYKIDQCVTRLLRSSSISSPSASPAPPSPAGRVQ